VFSRCIAYYRDKKIGVFVRFRAPLHYDSAASLPDAACQTSAAGPLSQQYHGLQIKRQFGGSATDND
jgi:hypothetical protein